MRQRTGIESTIGALESFVLWLVLAGLIFGAGFCVGRFF